MGAPKPLSKEEASAQVHGIYDEMQEAFGTMPNIFGVMARRPAALKNLLPFYHSVVAEGTVEAKYKELAYLKASHVNGCEY